MCQSCDDVNNLNIFAQENRYEYECDCCHATVLVDNMWSKFTVNGDYGDAVMPDPINGELIKVHQLCRDCYNKYHHDEIRHTCPICDNTRIIRYLNIMEYPIYYRDGSNIGCDSCVVRYTFYCDSCDERNPLWRDDRYSAANGNTICEECYQNNYFSCDLCSAIYHTDHMSEDDNGCICSYCHDSGAKLIHEYSYKPAPQFYGLKDGSDRRKKIFYGCELEVYVKSNSGVEEKAEEILDRLNSDAERVYLKKDSSIGRGFEIVTHPHTWDEIKKLWLENWDEKIRSISSHNSGTCGFHVHVSRRPLTKMHIQKMIVFVNAAENANLIKTVAQRDCSEWGKLKDYKKIGHCEFGEERYEAINLLNANTIEFRIFRGNLRKDRIMKNLEFVKATIDFTRDRSYRDLSSDSFLKFVRNNRKEFTNLHNYLENVSFFPDPAYAGDTNNDR